MIKHIKSESTATTQTVHMFSITSMSSLRNKDTLDNKFGMLDLDFGVQAFGASSREEFSRKIGI